MAFSPAEQRVRWEPGGQVGPYRLIERLARGGMAELYLATHEDDPRQVVIKRVHDHLRADPGFDAMFVRETRIAASLRHRNIVQVLATSEVDGSPYLVMELLNGLDVSAVLRRLRKRDGLLPIGDGIRIAIEAAHGLAYAHDKRDEDGNGLGIVHRDVSPSNLFVTREGEVKLLDFGIAKTTNATQITGAGVRKGKGSYMAPEQVLGGVVDRRSDVFALGAVLFELTTMRRAFEGDNDLAVLHAITTRSVDPPSTVVEGYPPALEQIILTAMQREPSDRWSTTSEMAEALEELSSRPGLASSPKRLSKLVGELTTKAPLKEAPEPAPSVDLTPPPFGVSDRSDGALLLPTPTSMDEIVGDDSGQLTVSEGRKLASTPSGPASAASPKAAVSAVKAALADEKEEATQVAPVRDRTVVAKVGDRPGSAPSKAPADGVPSRTAVAGSAALGSAPHAAPPPSLPDAPVAIDELDRPPSSKLPLVAGLASLAGVAALAWVFLFDSPPSDETPAAKATPAQPATPDGGQAVAPASAAEPAAANPASVGADPKADLARLNDRSAASAMGFSERHDALRRVNAAGLDGELDMILQLYLDVAQAAQAATPCTTFRGALRTLAAADHDEYRDDLAKVSVPTKPGADEDPSACEGLSGLLAAALDPATTKARPDKTSRSKPSRPSRPSRQSRPAKQPKPTPAPAPEQPPPPTPVATPEPPPKPKKPTTKLDDELRPFGN